MGIFRKWFRPIIIVLGSGSLLSACGGSYQPDDLATYLQSGKWYNDEYDTTLTFQGDGLYVWRMKVSDDDEDVINLSMLAAQASEYCGDIETLAGLDATELRAVLQSCDLPPGSFRHKPARHGDI